MKCQSCGTENRAQARFCEKCGALMKGKETRVCPNCGHENAASAKFCSECRQVLGMAQPFESSARRRVWLWGLLGMLLTLMLCCFSFLLLPQPPVEGSILPEPMAMLWESAVEKRDGLMQASGLSGSLLRGLSAILPGGKGKQEPLGGEKQETEVQCSSKIMEKKECEAAGGVLVNEHFGHIYCYCPGIGKDWRDGFVKMDKNWCLAEGGAWYEEGICCGTIVIPNKGIDNGNCSFVNQCADMDRFDGKSDECDDRGGLIWSHEPKGLQNDQCFCPRPGYIPNVCENQVDTIQLVSIPNCKKRIDQSYDCSVEMKNKPNEINPSGALLKWSSGRTDRLQQCEVLEAKGTIQCSGVIKNLSEKANVIWCWGFCCKDLGEFLPDQALARNLVAPAAQTCCENVRARNVKYFRDPPNIGALFLGFDMQCAGADWQLDGQCASFEALVGANRNMPWTSGECCPDPNYPDRLNCSGSIEGQKKSMTQVVMTYGGCTAEAEFQSPYQAPPAPEPAPEKKKDPSKDPSPACPSGQSMCAGKCCPDGHCSQNSDGSWECWQ